MKMSHNTAVINNETDRAGGLKGVKITMKRKHIRVHMNLKSDSWDNTDVPIPFARSPTNIIREVTLISNVKHQRSLQQIENSLMFLMGKALHKLKLT